MINNSSHRLLGAGHGVAQGLHTKLRSDAANCTIANADDRIYLSTCRKKTSRVTGQADSIDLLPDQLRQPMSLPQKVPLAR